MKLSELIDELQDAMDSYGDRDVLVAQQPSWPLTAQIVNVWVPDPDQYDDEPYDPDREVVWLATREGHEGCELSPYAPKAAWGGVE